MQRRLADVPGASEALTLIDDAYGTRLKRPGRDIGHPIAVAELLLADGQPDRVVIAGLLHDVLEDTDVTTDELQARFGPDVTRLVQALTQEPSIAAYADRKAALRHQIVTGSRHAATVSLADKVAKLDGRRKRPADRKLNHYRATLEDVENQYGPTPLSEQLRGQLSRWE